jgi:Family of unknown function (DUF6230)
MSEQKTAVPVSGRTGWRRFVLALLPAALAAVLLVGMTGQGGIAASFAVSGHRFKVSADSLQGKGFAQYGDVAATIDGERHPVAMSVIDDATLTNLCQSVVMDTPAGEVTLVVRAGQGGQPVKVRSLVIDLNQLTGDAEFTNMQIGRDAGTLENSAGKTGRSGGFGQQADTVRITRLEQTAYAVNAGTFTLTGLKMSLRRGKHECF